MKEIQNILHERIKNVPIFMNFRKNSLRVSSNPFKIINDRPNCEAKDFCVIKK